MDLSFKEISQSLLTVAEHMPPVSFNAIELVYQIEGFKIRCRPDRESVLRVAEKYRKGKKLSSSAMIRSRDDLPPAKMSVQKFINDGELDNAENYAALGQK